MRRRHLAGAAILALALLGACGDGGGEGSGGLSADADPAARRGEALAEEHRCISCHSIEGDDGVGPAWNDTAGTERTLVDGSTAVADSEYLTRAIIDPRVEVVEGYSPIMGSYAFLEDEEVADLVAYIEALAAEG